MLQNQYFKDCADNIFDVNYQVGKGRSNFNCMADSDYKHSNGINKEVNNCSNGYCVVKKNYKCKFNDICPYLSAKKAALSSDVALLNYDVKIVDNLYTTKLNYNPRYFSVCDEAHNIDNRVLNHVSLDLNGNTLHRELDFVFLEEYWTYTFAHEWYDILEHLIKLYDMGCADINAQIERLKFKTMGKLTNKKKKEFDEQILHLQKQAHHFENRMKKITETLKLIRENPDDWVVSRNKEKNIISFKPLFVHNYTHDYLFNSSKLHLFMSGSFGDIDTFISELNIPEDECKHIFCPSDFNFKKRNPIFNCNVANLCAEDISRNLGKCVRVMKKIFRKHSHDKGLIHCTSKETALDILNRFKGTRYFDRMISYGVLFNTTNRCVDYSYKDDSFMFKNAEEALFHFKKSEKPLICVSYSMEEGVDLKDDDCRFQVIVKVPYPNVGDERISRRLNIDFGWYNNETMKTFIQMLGRGMRSRDDYCSNYVLDDRFTNFYQYTKRFPKYLKGSIRNRGI